MPPRGALERPSVRTRSRVPKACKRCRDQKIRCTGSQPCDQCSKRDLACHFDNQSQRILVTRRYINDLHERLATLEYQATQFASPNSAPEQLASPKPSERGNTTLSALAGSGQDQGQQNALRQQSVNQPMHRDAMETTTPLTNPLAFHIKDWVPDPKGRPIFLGTSSSWAFGRRVFEMTHKRLKGSSLPPDNLLFDGHVYDLKWDGNRTDSPQDIFDTSSLPTPDFAGYLINAVKFHCGQLFYLFEESSFLERFTAFHQNPAQKARSSPLWFCHYLLILAFGKSFVVQSGKLQRPSGSEHFIQAMKCMPDLTFFDADPIQKIQVLCCAALYLQCLNNRAAGYHWIGLALRGALEHGMYTEMQSTYIDEVYMQRCNLMWWTVYVLERRMSSLMGVPMSIAEESISTSLPSSGHTEGSNVLAMQVRICQVLAKIDKTVYGVEGKLDSRYLGATQSVLRSIANITEQLNTSFDLYENGSRRAISRVSAHLHLQGHQCIILTTKPLLYIFLQSKLGQSNPALLDWLQSETVKSLLQICVESAQQSLRILSNLLEQGLLDSFLPFDMDAAFTATISLLMAAAIDPSLIQDHTPWTQRAYAILDEMDAHGNKSARLILSELRRLDSELAQLLMQDNMAISLPANLTCESGPTNEPTGIDPSLAASGYNQSLENMFEESFGHHYELSPGQLMDLANSLDINSLTWPVPSMGDFDTHDI